MKGFKLKTRCQDLIENHAEVSQKMVRDSRERKFPHWNFRRGKVRRKKKFRRKEVSP